MPNINDINNAVYALVRDDPELGALAGVYKGPRRPNWAAGPSVTLEAKRLERGEGEGIWLCDIIATVFVPLVGNGLPDHETFSAVTGRLGTLLADAELSLENARALPLIEGDSGGPAWDGTHEGEMREEQVYGLVLVQYS